MTSKLSFRQCAAYLSKHGQPVSATTGYFDRLKAVQAVKSKLAAVPSKPAAAAPSKAAPSPLPAAKPAASPAGPVRPAPVAAVNPPPAPTPETIGRQVATAFVFPPVGTLTENIRAIEEQAAIMATATGQSVWQAKAWARFEAANRIRNSK
jgi:hypothetical protein